jgi:acetyl-CoA carboxylase biotin carboxyl carrier protein
MYKINEIKELIRALDKSSVTELTIKNDNKEQVTIKKGGFVSAEYAPSEVQVVAAPQASAPTPVQAPAKEEEKAAAPSVDDSSLHKIVSPMVGTFYSSPTPEEGPYVTVGDSVTESSVICIVEAMKLMNELEAEINGEVVEILVENGQLVEYGQPLFLVKLS